MIDPIGKLTEKDWWDRIFANEESQDDPDLRLGFACWLQDECDDPGAGYLRWCLDTGQVDWWHKELLPIRGPRVGERKDAWWYRTEDKSRMAENMLPEDVLKELANSESLQDTRPSRQAYRYLSRRLAEEDALRAWRKARSPNVSENEKEPAGR